MSTLPFTHDAFTLCPSHKLIENRNKTNLHTLTFNPILLTLFPGIDSLHMSSPLPHISHASHLSSDHFHPLCPLKNKKNPGACLLSSFPFTLPLLASITFTSLILSETCQLLRPFIYHLFFSPSVSPFRSTLLCLPVLLP